eukprot:TRINITY_DN9146_c0_g2_i1.p2 TRINITY_DN9146_c0_g2~~TRINITY_DN9146_c0_g2_i1.p2  ORF type:complete len:580 (+),score=291.81 TRINITY_DN9146_c0_g2_i1:3332-5071(+)
MEDAFGEEQDEQPTQLAETQGIATQLPQTQLADDADSAADSAADAADAAALAAGTAGSPAASGAPAEAAEAAASSDDLSAATVPASAAAGLLPHHEADQPLADIADSSGRETRADDDDHRGGDKERDADKELAAEDLIGSSDDEEAEAPAADDLDDDEPVARRHKKHTSRAALLDDEEDEDDEAGRRREEEQRQREEELRRQQRAEIDELFGASSDDDDMQPPLTAAAPTSSSTAASAADTQRQRQQEDGMADDDEEATTVQAEADGDEGTQAQQQQQTLPAEQLEYYWLPRPANNDRLVFGRLPNVLTAESRPFDPAAYDEVHLGAEATDDRARKLALNPPETVIRWRFAASADSTGSLEKESNCRFIRWSDGTTQLLVGAESYDVHQQACEPDEVGYAFVRQKQFIKCHGRFGSKLILRPTSLASKSHQALSTMAAQQARKERKVKLVSTEVDPEQDKLRRELEIEQRLDAKRRLELSRQRKSRAYLEGGELSSQLLEDGAGSDLDDALEGNIKAIKARYRKQPAKAAAAKRRSSSRRDDDVVDSDDELAGGVDDEDDVAMARKKRKKRTVHNSESD